jgi:hypothetical protein
MDDDDAPLDFEFGASKKSKAKTAAQLAAEKAKAEEEANAKLSFKGKPSSFFIMDHVEGDQQDPTGSSRVPTAEQRVFIYANYPTESLPHLMIMKIYQLYADAVAHEKAKEREKEAYKPASRSKQPAVETYEEIILNDEEETTFGMLPKKQTKKTQK